MEEEKRKKMREVVNGVKPVIVMMAVAAAFAAGTILYKIATEDGMNFAVLNAYRFIFATAFMVPLALFYERKKIPKLTWRVLFMTFLCGLFGGTLFQNLNLESLVLTTATFVSASYNLIPAITFVLAISFGLEKLNLGGAAGRAKVIGTMVGIGGAMVMTFVKGPYINIWPSHMLPRHHHPNAHVAHHNDIARQVLGVVCAFGSCFAYAFWLILQGMMSRSGDEYPSHNTNTALMSAMAAIQSTAFGLCVERDWRQWKLGWNIRLLTVVYSGVVASGLMVAGIAWCVEKRGPLFVSVFSPFLLLFVAIASSFILDEKLFIGSLLGAVLIVCGLYMVLWGKGKEAKNVKTQPAPDLPLHDHKSDHFNDSKDQKHDEDSNAKEKQEEVVSSNV